MSIVVVREPAEISFSKNPIIFKLQSDARVDNPGSAAVNDLQFIGNIVDGTVVVLRWKGEQQRMVARDTVLNPGFEFPSGTVSQAYITQILPYFKDNFYLDRDFLITSVMTSGAGGLIHSIRFTSREPGRENQFIPQSTPLVKITIKTPGIDVVLKPNFRIQAELWIQKPGTSDFEKIFSEPLEVDESGSAEWDIANLLHPELSPDYHNWSGRSLNFDIKSKRQYYIRYAEAWGERFQVGKVFKHTTKHVTMGGTPYEAGPSVKVADLLREGTDPARDRCLRYGPDVRFVFPDEPAFLSFVNTRPAYGNFQMKVTAKMSFSGNADVVTVPVPNGLLVQYARVTANVGFAQLGLNQLVTTDAVESYTCQFFNGNTPVSRPYTFVLDYSNKPYRRYFTYHNSLGAFDSMHTWGKGSNEIELAKQTTKNYLKPDYAYTDGTFDDWDLTYRQKFQAATGYRQKAEIRMFKDFYISRYKHRFTESKPLPVTILSGSVKEFEDGNHLYAQTFEYAYQFDDDTVTEDIEDSSLSYSPPPGFQGATGGPIVVAVPPAPGYGSNGQLLYDPVPTEGSANIPRSGGVWSELQKLQVKLPLGANGQYIRGDHTLGNFSQDVAPLIQNELTKFKSEQLPNWITSENSSARIAADQINDSANESGLFYAAAITKAAGWPANSLGASLVRVYNGAPGQRRGSDVVQTHEGKLFVRTKSEPDGDGPWMEVVPGEEPTFENIPHLRFPIGQITIQTIDLAKYLVSTHTLPLQMKELSSPEWVQSIEIDGLKAKVTGLPSSGKEKGIVVEVTDTDTGKSRTVSIPVEARAQVDVKYNLYNPLTSSVITEIPQDGSGIYVNREKIDLQIVVADEPHDGVSAAIVGGGADGTAINEKWTDQEFEQLPDVVNGGIYRMWKYFNGRSIPDGTYQLLFKAFLKGQEIYSKTITFKLTASVIGQADFELWDESTGNGYKLTDIATDNSTIVQPFSKYDIHFAVKNTLHNQVFAKIVDENTGTTLFSWNGPYESVPEATDHIYHLFGPGANGNAPGTAGKRHVYFQAFLNGVQVYAKDNIFEIASEGTSPSGTARFEFWNETPATAEKVGDILQNNSSSFAVQAKGEVKINLFNARHNQVYAEIRNSVGTALFTFNKPYETVPTAENAVYSMFGNQSWTNIAAGGYQIYFKAQMDGIIVYEKAVAFVLTSESQANPIKLELRNVTTNAVVGTLTNGSSFPLPSLWDITTVVTGPHDAWTAILDKKINGSYDNGNYWFNPDSTAYPGVVSVTRHVFNGQGNIKYETASRIFKEGQYRLTVTALTGGLNGIVVAKTQIEFTLTEAVTPTLSGIELWHKDPNATGNSYGYLLDLDLPVNAGSYALPSTPIEFITKRSNSTVRVFEVKIEQFKNGAFYPLDMGNGGPYSTGPIGAEKLYRYAWVDNDLPKKFLNDVMGVGPVGNIYENGTIVGNINQSPARYRVTVYEKTVGLVLVKTRTTTFSFGNPPASSTIPPYTKTPKLLFDLVNEGGNYRDATPGDYIENGVRYRDYNGRKYKALYWINEVPWANGDVPKDLGTIPLRNGLIVSIRKCYADSNPAWNGSKTFTDFVKLGWDFWAHGGENVNADINLLYRTIVIHFTTNGGSNLGHGSMIREENPSWLVADKMVPQYYFNASPYGKSDKPVCIQCVPFDPGNPQLTADRLANGGVTHIFWQNIHGAGLYEYSTGQPKPGVDLHGLKPCFNLASQQFHDTIGNWFTPGMQATEAQARQTARNTPMRDGAVYTDEFTEGSFPQFEQVREWFYDEFNKMAQEHGYTVINGGDYGYGSQNVTLRKNPGRYEPMGDYMKSLTTPNVIANLDSVGVTSHLKFKQYAMYQAVYRDCVLGRYYAITEHPLSERMAVKALEAIITINAVPNKSKVAFHAGFMQSNANGTDVPYKDSGTLKPDGSINYNYPDTPGEVMRFDAFMDKLLLEAIYLWDMYGVKDANDVNSWYGSNFGTDAYMVGSRMYDKCIPFLNEAGRQLICADFTANGVAFNSTTPERRISRKNNPVYNNIYFNEVLDKKCGASIVIPSSKKVIIYWNFYKSPTEVEDVTVRYNGQSYHIGEVAGSTFALCFEP